MEEIRWKFETFLRDEIPWKLKLSPSKRVAMSQVFYHISDEIMALEQKAPAEFKMFFDALVRRFDRVSRWKAPKGQQVTALFTANGPLEYPDKSLRYGLTKKA